MYTQSCLLDHASWHLTEEERGMLGLESFKLAIHFLLHLYCRTRKKLRWARMQPAASHLLLHCPSPLLPPSGPALAGNNG